MAHQEILNRHGFRSGWLIDAEGEPINEADVNLSTVRSGSVTGAKTVTPSVVKACVNADNLERRHTLSIFNDSSFLVYYSFESNPTLGMDTQLIPSGANLKFKLDPNDDMDVWLLSENLDVEIKIVELR